MNSPARRRETTMKRWMLSMTAGLLMISMAHASFGKELVVGVSNFEPFFIEENESGIFVDILKEVFKLMPDYTVKFSFMTNRRLLEDLNSGALDAAVNMLTNYELNEVHLSKPAFRYRDAVIALKKNNFVITSIADLKDKSISTHQGSLKYLGAEFEAMASAHPNYREMRQNSQICEMVASGKMDVGIEDPMVFFFDLKRMFKGEIQGSDFQIFPIFKEDYTLMGFKDPAARDAFDAALETVKTNGTYDAVFKKYQEEFGITW